MEWRRFVTYLSNDPRTSKIAALDFFPAVGLYYFSITIVVS